MKYKVEGSVQVKTDVIVEANSPQEAFKIASDKLKARYGRSFEGFGSLPGREPVTEVMTGKKYFMIAFSNKPAEWVSDDRFKKPEQSEQVNKVIFPREVI